MGAGAFVAVGAGAALGAWARWLAGAWLNPVLPSLPLGTLAVNLAGGYLIGIAIAFFAAHASLAPEWRLLVVTGFLGAMTTFSTFSAESVELLQLGRYAAAAAHSAAHLAGSIFATILGFATYRGLT